MRACITPHCTADFALKAQVHRSVSAPTPSITTDFPHPILPLFLAATRSARRVGPLAAASATATSTCAAPNRQQALLSTACRFCLSVHLPLPQLPFLQCELRRPSPCKRAAQGTAVMTRWSHVTLLTHVLQALHAQLAAVVFAFVSLLSLS